MTKAENKIEVGFYGALKSGGRIWLTKPATPESGLDAVGGLATPKKTMWPARIVRVRRRQGGKMKAFRKFDMSAKSEAWKHFKLRSGDAVIFQWQVVINHAD